MSDMSDPQDEDVEAFHQLKHDLRESLSIVRTALMLAQRATSENPQALQAIELGLKGCEEFSGVIERFNEWGQKFQGNPD